MDGAEEDVRSPARCGGSWLKAWFASRGYWQNIVETLTVLVQQALVEDGSTAE
jgi:hypothetical protein